MWEIPRTYCVLLCVTGIVWQVIAFFSAAVARSEIVISYIVCGTVLLVAGGILGVFTHQRNNLT
jgi:hypothetical protein